MKRSVSAVVLVLGLSLGMVGCASGPPSSAPTTSPVAEPSSTPSATATPEPTEPAEAEAERIVIGGNGVVVLGADGAELVSFDFLQDTADLVSGFTELFGSDPVETPFEPTTHFAGGIEHDWDGFTVLDMEGDAQPPYLPNHSVRITTDEVAGITIESEGGLRVGASVENVLAAGAEETVRPTDATYRNFVVDSVPAPGDDPACPEDEGCLFSVLLTSDDAAESVVRMSAPSPNFGP